MNTQKYWEDMMKMVSIDFTAQQTDIYCAECGKAQEEIEAIESEAEHYCTKCCVCGRKILPRETALTVDGGDTFFHESHLEETSGRDLAIENGCDYDVMDQYMEMNA